jgi:hypothetical protein
MTKTRPTIYEALAKAQGEMTNPKKDTKAFQYKYTQLDQIIDIAKPVLAKHGLGIIQFPKTACGDEGQNLVGVQTVIFHDSGETIESEYFTQQTKPGPQEMGSLLTYMRRYAYLGAVGIHPQDEDDDAKSVQPNKSVAKTFEKPTPKKKAPAAKPTFTLNTSPEAPESTESPVFDFGKFKGKAVNDVPLEELVGYFNFLKSRENYNPASKPELFQAIQERVDDFAH